MSETVKPGDNRLRGLDPQKLLVLEIEEIAPLLEVQYPALVARGAELLANAVQWAVDSKVDGQVVIQDDAAMNRASELYKQVQTYASATGEVEEARRKVSDPLFSAKRAVDAWFKARRERLEGALEVINEAQRARVRAVRAQEEAERRRQAMEAQERAHRLLDAARKADAITQPAMLDAAVEADVEAAEALIAAAAPITDLTRIRSTLGVTTSGSETWNYRVVDFKALLASVVAGTAPDTFIMVADSAIKAAIRGKNGRRSVPGLEIFPETKVNRRG